MRGTTPATQAVLWSPGNDITSTWSNSSDITFQGCGFDSAGNASIGINRGKNITFADVDASGGAKVPASVLYPNDPKRRLEVPRR